MSLAAAPANDDFSAAIPLAGAEVRASGDNLDATAEVDEPVHAGNGGGTSVWWSWTAPFSGPVLVDTLVSRFDTLLGVYTGEMLDALMPVATNDDAEHG